MPKLTLCLDNNFGEKKKRNGREREEEGKERKEKWERDSYLFKIRKEKEGT